MYTPATVHVGPNGGTEYRLWTRGEIGGIFVVVGRYKAWPHMSASERAKADAMEAERRDAKRRQAESDASWRSLRAGR